MSRSWGFNEAELKTFVNDLINKYNNLKHFEELHKMSFTGLDGILIYDTEDFFRIAKLFAAEIKEEDWESDLGLKYRYSMKIRDIEFSTYTFRKEEFE